MSLLFETAESIVAAMHLVGRFEWYRAPTLSKQSRELLVGSLKEVLAVGNQCAETCQAPPNCLRSALTGIARHARRALASWRYPDPHRL